MILARIAAVALGASVAHASTWIVDAGGGGQFTDIQTAILASGPGDVLLVQPGTYAPFALDRSLTLIGHAPCNVTGGIYIAGVLSTDTAAVVGIEAPLLDIQACEGTVIVQDMQQLQRISISLSNDVRLARVAVSSPPSTTPPTTLEIEGSRVEVVASNIQGCPGLDCAIPPVAGGIGATCLGSRLHMSRSSLSGGAGGTCSQVGTVLNDGGMGLDLQTGAYAILCGRSTDVFNGGGPGTNWAYPNDCSYDGQMGIPVLVRSTTGVRCSGVTIPDQVIQFGTSCTVVSGPGVVSLGGTLLQPAPADPTLTVAGTPLPGGTQVFTLDAPPGSTALLYFGRKPSVIPAPGAEIELLTRATLVVNLGLVPASGTVTYLWHVASVLTPGVTCFAQADVTVAPGDLRRTNSIPVIVR